MRAFVFTAAFLGSLLSVQADTPGRYVAVDRASGALVTLKNGALLFQPTPGANASEINVALEKPFFPLQMAGSYILGTVGGLGEDAYTVVVDRRGIRWGARGKIAFTTLDQTPNWRPKVMWWWIQRFSMTTTKLSPRYGSVGSPAGFALRTRLRVPVAGSKVFTRSDSETP